MNPRKNKKQETAGIHGISPVSGR